MKYEKVASESVAEVGYDPMMRLLGVRWKNGATYHYQDVPNHVYARLQKAASVSKFLTDHVRYSYNWTKAHADA